MQMDRLDEIAAEALIGTSVRKDWSENLPANTPCPLMFRIFNATAPASTRRIRRLADRRASTQSRPSGSGGGELFSPRRGGQSKVIDPSPSAPTRRPTLPEEPSSLRPATWVSQQVQERETNAC